VAPKIYEAKRQSLGIFFEILLHKFGKPLSSLPNDPFGSCEHPGIVIQCHFFLFYPFWLKCVWMIVRGEIIVLHLEETGCNKKKKTFFDDEAYIHEYLYLEEIIFEYINHFLYE